MKKIAFLTALAAFVGLSNAAPYAAWTKYREVIVNTTNTGGGANVAGTVSNFPVLVRLSNASEAAGANVLSEALAGGADVRFTDSTGNAALPYEIDAWSASAAAIWVRVPSVAGNASTKIRIYWNRSNVSTASNSGDVFTGSAGFLGAWHMGNSATPETPRPNAVAGGNPATPMNITNADNPFKAGTIGMADTLRSQIAAQAQADYFDLGDGYADFAGGQVTLSMWVWRTHVNDGWNQFLSFGNDANVDNIWFGKQGTTAKNFTFEVPPPTAHIHAAGALASNENQWIHLLATNDHGASNMYVNGAQVMTGTTGTPTAANRVQNYIARSVDAWADRNLRGKVDEVRVSNAFRSADWVKLDYETQKLTATAVTLGTTQAPAAPKLAYFTKSAVYMLNQAIASNLNVTNGTVSGSFAVLPSLPAGLALNPTTGVISGTPTAVTASAQYVVTVTVDAAPVSDTLTIAVTAGTPPGVPTGVAATPGGASATVTWTAPGSSGTSAITAYTVRAVEDTAKTCGWTTGTLSCTVTGLTNGTPYTFVVRATSAVGTSAFSTASAPVTPAAVPSPPLNVAATQGTSGTAVVSWSAPASNGGLSVTDYYVTAAPGGLQCYSPPITNPTCNVTGLTGGTAYTFTVIAANAMGNSNPSAPSAPLTMVVGILTGPFAIQVTGSSRPFVFALTEEAMESTDALTMTISDLYGRTVWSKTVNPKANKDRELRWNSTTSTGHAVSAGVYMVRVSTVGGGQTARFIQKAVLDR